MRKGFTKAERATLEEKIGNVDSAIDLLTEFMRERHVLAEEWMGERSEAWFETEKCEEFEAWVNELDFKIDEIEQLKDEISIDALEEII